MDKEIAVLIWRLLQSYLCTIATIKTFFTYYFENDCNPVCPCITKEVVMITLEVEIETVHSL